MESEWMGRYRPLVAALIRQTNIAISDLSVKHDIGNGIYLNNNEWQILEYIVEHRNDDDRMIYISQRLAIPQSTFSKVVKKLVAAKLVERYQMANNRKNIILKPTELGIDLYNENVKKIVAQRFAVFFKPLESLSDEALAAFTQALDALSDEIESSEGLDDPEKRIELIKLD